MLVVTAPKQCLYERREKQQPSTHAKQSAHQNIYVDIANVEERLH